MKRALLPLAAAALVGTAWAGGTPAPTPASKPRPAAKRVPAASVAFDFAHRIGLVEGDRQDSLWLMIADSTLAVGDSLTLISDEPHPDADTYVTLISAVVAERLPAVGIYNPARNPYERHETPSPHLNKMRREKGDHFYRLAAPPGSLDCCIFGYAVRAPRDMFRIVSGRAEADLDGDGVIEHFQSCASRKGLHPTVWSGEPFLGVQRWHRAYHLGYDVEPDCPGLDPFWSD